MFEQLARRDIANAADLLRSVYDATNTLDGYVSLEVSPDLANNTEATIEQARELWKLMDRPNLMVKVPGTQEGVPAIATLHRRRPEHQCHAVVFGGRLTRRPLTRICADWNSAPPKASPSTDRQCGQLLRQPHRYRSRQAAAGSLEDRRDVRPHGD